MTLPEPMTPWPPKELKPLLDRLTEWDAWYGGDRATLASLYGRGSFEDRRPSTLARFWSRPRSAAARDDRLHIPLPADIASTSAQLLFGEPPKFTVENEGAQTRIDELAEGMGLDTLLLEVAEVASALGGVYLKVDWDRDLVPDHPIAAAVHADAAIPEWSWGILTAVTFWRVVEDTGAKVLRFLERHSTGQIELALYDGTRDNLGRPVPLTEHPETAAMTDGLTDGNVKATGTPLLTAVYLPNIRPMRGPGLRGTPHGRSDFDQLEPQFDALDEAWSSWMRDLRLGKARLIVPTGFLTNLGPGQGASFDLDREVWAELQMPPTKDNAAASISPQQFDIRVEEHRTTVEQLVRSIVQSAGYAAQTFGLVDAGGAVTATEVAAKERRSMVTRDRKIRYVRPVLRDFLTAVLAIDKAIGFPGAVEPAAPLVEFGDGVSEDPNEVATTLELLNRAEAISTEMKVRMLHPDWDDPDVDEEVARIEDERAADVPDPAMFGGQPDDVPGPPKPAGGDK